MNSEELKIDALNNPYKYKGKLVFGKNGEIGIIRNITEKGFEVDIVLVSGYIRSSLGG